MPCATRLLGKDEPASMRLWERRGAVTHASRSPAGHPACPLIHVVALLHGWTTATHQ